MHKVKWGIIGCGDVTEIKSGPAFSKIENSELIAVMRRDEEKCKDYAARHNIAEWHTDAEKLIHHPHINAIYIATPPDTHEAITIAALKGGKDVYVEKPMALSAASCMHMIEVAEQTGKKLCVAHYRREQPFFKKIKELIHNGAIGDVRTIELQMHLHLFTQEQLEKPGIAWRVNPEVSGGGIFHDLAPHQLDILYNIFGEAKHVAGIATHQAKAYAAHDAVAGIIQFRNDALFTGSWSFNMVDGHGVDQCIITGSHGKLRFSFFGDHIIHFENSSHTEKMEFEIPYHVQQPLIEAVVKYFSGQTNHNPSPGREAATVMQWMDIITS